MFDEIKEYLKENEFVESESLMEPSIHTNEENSIDLGLNRSVQERVFEGEERKNFVPSTDKSSDSEEEEENHNWKKKFESETAH